MFRAIIVELKRLIETLMGKWSLSVWMNTVKKFSDETIQEVTEQDGLTYQNGTCTVEYTPGNDILAHVQLIFKAPTDDLTQIEAKRIFAEKRFLSETLEELAQQGKLKIPIEMPEKE